MSGPHVLLAEDDDGLRPVVEGLLGAAGFRVLAGVDGAAALAAFEQALAAGDPVDAAVCDIRMPGLDGLALTEQLHRLDPELPVVFVTAYASVDTAVAALRAGAWDYITKPFQNERLVQVVRNAVAQRRLARENRSLKRELERAVGVEGIVGRSPGMAAVLRVVEKAAPSDAAVLIRGETGTGKELVARALHRLSDRRDGPFVTLNCAALPEGLLESELFGHEKGAFTGATKSAPGLFRAAHGGTLLLDEVGEMPAGLQAKLLRALENRRVRPVGATAEIAVDVRIVGATNRDLLAEVEAGSFREDLYYRLAVIELEVPSLRARPMDVAPLARFFLEQLAGRRGESARRLTPEARAALEAYAWPGNVRELRNALERAVTLGGETIAMDDLPPRLRAAVASERASDADDAGVAESGVREGPVVGPISRSGRPLSLSDLERLQIEAVLAEAGGDRRRAAGLLGIDPSTLYRKRKRWEADAGDGAPTAGS